MLARGYDEIVVLTSSSDEGEEETSDARSPASHTTDSEGEAPYATEESASSGQRFGADDDAADAAKFDALFGRFDVLSGKMQRKNAQLTAKQEEAMLIMSSPLAERVSALLFTVTFYANLAHSFDSLPRTSLTLRPGPLGALQRQRRDERRDGGGERKRVGRR
jgi:hypothetical protein